MVLCATATAMEHHSTSLIVDHYDIATYIQCVAIGYPDLPGFSYRFATAGDHGMAMVVIRFKTWSMCWIYIWDFGISSIYRSWKVKLYLQLHSVCEEKTAGTSTADKNTTPEPTHQLSYVESIVSTIWLYHLRLFTVKKCRWRDIGNDTIKYGPVFTAYNKRNTTMMN